MRPVLSADQMREMDRQTIADVGLPGAVLMETAGRAVAGATRELVESRPGAVRVAVVCGSGNNGGDGFVAARVLAEHGVTCEVFLVMEESGIQGDARIFYDALLQCGGSVFPIHTAEQRKTAIASLGKCDVIIDAIFGTGLCREISGPIADLVRAINESSASVVAVDIPSGLAADTGAILGVAVDAQVTVTMGAAKVGNVSAPGFARNGRLCVAEIGIPSERLQRAAEAFVVEASDVRPLVPSTSENAHKVARGHVLAIAGSVGKRGAGRLAGVAALRTGAGLVTLGAIAPDQGAPDPLMTATVSTCEELADACQGKHALLIGPGMQTDAPGKALVMHAIEHSPIAMVLDADALNHIAASPRDLRNARVPVVLTPHPGEAARLLAMRSAEVQADRLATARRLAAETRAVVILKGARSCIVDGRVGGQTVLLCDQGGPELATAGTGDVLAGMVAALLAQRLDAADAAMLAVYWHGVAGQTALRRLGGMGVVASDVVMSIPAARTEICSSAGASD